VALTEEKSKRKIVVGMVIGDKMDKTISVRTQRIIKHPKYGKFLKRFTTYKVHDEKNEAKVGDNVEIVSCSPVSKSKKCQLLNIKK